MASDYQSAESSGSANLTIVTKQSLFDKMQLANLPTFEERFNHLSTELLSSNDYSEDQIKDLKRKLSHLKSQFKKRWQKAIRKQDTFLKYNMTWLQGTFEMPNITRKPTGSSLSTKQVNKRKDTESLQDGESELTPLKALSTFVEADLSRQQYEILRNYNRHLYPSYSALKKAKLDCYPSKDSYRVTETCSEINLQDLLNHTVTRLFKCLEEGFNKEECGSLELVCKWGCDGPSQSQFENKSQSYDTTDSYFFLSYLVPLELVCRTDGRKLVWQNPIPSSSRYCRPIRIRVLSEETNITNDEIKYIENQISSLEDYKYTVQDAMANIKFSMTLTMEDAKMNKAATKTISIMRSYIQTFMNEQGFETKSLKETCNMRVLNRLLLTSDPLVSSIRLKIKKASRPSKVTTVDPGQEGEDSDSGSASEEDMDNFDDESSYSSSS